jgi:D-amino-acid oxidase
MTARVTVVGAGVIGLSCAVRLAEAGLEVDVLARDLPQETTSATAAALWLPSLAEPQDAVARWAAETLAELRRLAEPGPAGSRSEGRRRAGTTGVRVLAGTLLHRDATPRDTWTRRLGDDVPLAPVADPAPGYRVGYRAELPVVDMPAYLDHLVHRLEAADGTLTRMPLPALPTRGVVVNCSGVAAHALARDPQVRPVRGQTVLVENPGLAEWWWYEAPQSLTFVVPRGRVVVVGTTLVDGEWDRTPDPAAAREVLERAGHLVPRLRDARVLGHRVGLRPTRPVIRVEARACPTADDPDHFRVHCYGHGDNGLTLSWGSAGAVLDAVRDRSVAALTP